jgi:hypothetical protein
MRLAAPLVQALRRLLLPALICALYLFTTAGAGAQRPALTDANLVAIIAGAKTWRIPRQALSTATARLPRRNQGCIIAFTANTRSFI